MQQPLQITIRDIPHSDAVEQHIREKTDKLTQFAPNIISCHVIVEQTQKHQHQGKLYGVHINLAMPGKEFATTRKEDENLYVAVRDAFDSMREQITTYSEQLQGRTKTHPDVTHGIIARLFDQDGFGFITGANDTEFYFNESNVVFPEFQKLKVGQAVHFIEAMGDDGPQAKRVRAKRAQES